MTVLICTLVTYTIVTGLVLWFVVRLTTYQCELEQRVVELEEEIKRPYKTIHEYLKLPADMEEVRGFNISDADFVFLEDVQFRPYNTLSEKQKNWVNAIDARFKMGGW